MGFVADLDIAEGMYCYDLWEEKGTYLSQPPRSLHGR